MNNLCIIPARGGSKRIHRKNIKDFFGKPIISYSIETAQKSGLFNKLMVSTEDMEIADISIRYGAQVPFLRSGSNSDDFATLADVLMEVINQFEILGEKYDNICCVLPTAPLIKPERIQEAYRKLIENDFDSVVPVVGFSYPIFRALEFDDKNNLRMIWPEHIKSRSQDLKPAFHDTGSFYWIKTKALLEQKSLFTQNCSAIVLSETEVQDIDSEIDWKLAELKYQLSNG